MKSQGIFTFLTLMTVVLATAGCDGGFGAKKLPLSARGLSSWGSPHRLLNSQPDAALLPGDTDLLSYLDRKVVCKEDQEVKIAADRFSILTSQRDGGPAPELIVKSRGPYSPGQPIGSLAMGLFSFENTVWDPQGNFPSAMLLRNGGNPVAEFQQGLRLLGAGTIAGPGPGGISAMFLQSLDATESSSATSGAIVTVGGMSVARSTNIGGDLAVMGRAFKPGGGSWASASDRRLKENIRPLTDALARIERLNPVSYDWRNPREHGGLKSEQGFIAQEVEKVFPEFVQQSACRGKDCELTKGGKIKTLSLPFAFDAYVVGAIKELNSKLSAISLALDRAETEIRTQSTRADIVHATELCIEDLCIDEPALRTLLTAID